MQIITEFDVGHRFWVARVEWHEVEDVIITNGKSYVSRERILVALAKPKIVDEIVVHVDPQSVDIQYWGRSHPETEWSYNRIYHVDELRITSEAAALIHAREYLAKHGAPYHGP
jgi:hypothetical protein